MRDIAEFKKLGINTVRVYTVDNTANHDACMAALANAGIYLALDVNTPNYSINRGTPAPSYNAVYLQSIFATMDAFAGYSNTLLFFSGNEVINDNTTTDCAPYVKAVTRDMKQYRTSRGMRAIPIGYSAADVSENRYEMATYMNCGTDDQRSDFFAFNDYSWCDPNTFEGSGWAAKVQLYSNYSIPLFLSEYGCIQTKRQFQEVSALYNSEMTNVYSGGLVYEYSEEGSGYGLVNISGNQVTEKSDFTALQQAFQNTQPPSGDGGYQSNNQPASCPATSDTWQVTAFTGEALPAIPQGAVQYMKNGAGKGPGLTGDGSQNAGGASSGTASAGSGSATAQVTGSSSTSSSTSTSSKGAAAGLTPPQMAYGGFVTVAVMVLSSFFGAALL